MRRPPYQVLFAASVTALTAAATAHAPTRAATAAAPDTTRYLVIFSGNTAGAEQAFRAPDGSWRYRYHFNDRGRGPDIEERVVLGADAIPRSVAITGHDYFKVPVAETLSVQGGTARWRNRSEQGSRRVARPAFYVSLAGAPEELALLARALLAAPGHRLDLLPAGEAGLERVAERTLHRGRETRRVSEYAITGLDFSPVPVWLDADGGFFAQTQGWFSVVRAGWESCLDTLDAAQDAVEGARLAAVAARLAPRSRPPLVFEHARLFDSERASVAPGRTVVVEGSRIVAVGADDSVAIPAGARRIDATGRTLLPGLWDMHVHLGPTDGLLHLANGVTTVRDMGNDMDLLGRLKQRYDSGVEIGPRIIRAGLIDGRGPYQGPTKVFADSLPEAMAAIARYAEHGYVQIKIYSSIHPDLVPGIVAEAHRRGLRVSGHVPAFMTAEQFVRDGVDEIQHMNFLFLNFFADSVADTRTPARFTAVARMGADLDPASPRVRSFIELLRDRHIVIDPTLGVFEGLFVDRPGALAAGLAEVGDRLPIQVRRNASTGGLAVPDGMDARYRTSFQRMLDMLKALHDAGVPIVAGTDGLAGFMLPRELELYVRAGLSPAEVLQIATIRAARLMKRDGELGSIAPGKRADMILVDGAPDRDIHDIRNVELVLKDGVPYRTADLDEAIGVRPLPAMAGSAAR